MAERRTSLSDVFRRMGTDLRNPEQLVDLLEERERRDRPPLGTQYAPPEGPVEEVLAAIWARVLGVDRVGARDDFFQLGGQSLLAAQMLSRAAEAFGVELPLRSVFDHRTLGALALRIEEARGAGDGAQGEPLRPRPPGEEPVLSFAQERLWFLARLAPGSTAYDMPFTARFEGRLSLPLLARALTAAVARHEGLRATFPTRDGRPRVVISDPAPVPLPLIDLSGLAPAPRGAEAARLAARDSRHAFDLARGPLFRATLVRLGPGEHLALLDTHHIVSDGWSTDVLLREVAAVYLDLLDERAPSPPGPAVSYADFARWQRRRLAGGTLERELTYWRETLGGEPAPLDLPTDRPWSAARDARGDRCSTNLPEDLVARLTGLCRREGATLFMALLAALQTLLGRLAGQEEVTVGTPVAGRGRAGLDGLVGLFLDTLALRTDLSGGPTFRELLGRVREVVLGAFAHQEAPFEKLVEELRPRRDLARNPLFDVLLNLVNVPWSRLELPGLQVSFEAPVALESKFALSLHVFPRGEALELRLTYRTALFDRARAESILDQLRVLLEKAVAEPDLRIGSYSLVTPAARRLLPDPAAPLERPVHVPVTAAVEAAAEAAPERVAVRRGGAAWSYGELVVRARELAAALDARSGRRGEVTAVEGRPSFGLMVALQGVLRAGAVVLPVDPELPAARRRTVLREAGARRMVRIGVGSGDAYPGLDVLELHPESGRPEGGAGAPPGPAPDPPGPEEPAYVFFTSGTTGVPKGILGRHDGLAHFLDWERRTFGVGPGDRSSQLVSLSFDAVLRDVFLPLTAGASLCLPVEPAPAGRGAARTLSWLREQGVTVIHATPSLARAWLAGASGGEGLPALRLVLLAGEPVTGDLVRRWRELVSGGAEIVNLYGPTEATLTKTWYRVPAAPAPGAQPAGRALPQTQVLVLSPSDELCGVGELGEIALRTPFLTAGYLNAPEEQAARFRANPFRHDPADLVYGTGDLGRYRPDGSLEVLGRRDGQVKVRGVRVELGEVEAVLARHPDLSAAAVAARTPSGGEVELLAYAVAAPGRSVGAEALREHLRGELPEPLVPPRFTFLDELPLTATGKLDRRALPDPEEPAGGLGRGAPRSDLERVVAGVWREVLGVAEVGREDNFFDLGGHSLRLVEVHDRLRRATGSDLELVDLFRHTTVAALARRLEGTEAAGAPRAARHAPPRASGEGREVAIVGMAGRFPGAPDLARFWQNLRDGVEPLSVFDDRVLEANGVPPDLLRSPGYVKAGMVLDGIELFDAELFGFTPLEARLLDPQHRIFLEGAWEALETAGCDPRRFPGRVGVFAGVQRSSYLVNLYSHPELVRSVGDLMIKHATDKDYMVTRLSYRLGLRGPSVAVQTACSTSLVAVHLACQSLLTGDSDMALAGGVTVRVPQERGYEFREGGVLSPDGRCRAFDARGRGTVFTNGMGVVVLKRLDRALEDGDTVRAVILGSAINNDGSDRIGYTAPSVSGQADVIASAQRAAGVAADSITYVEAHGTATELGDPIEVAALTEAFRAGTSRTGFCALGSVKTNVGHLDTAAGIGGLIKTVLALEHRQIPPTLHFEAPNPRIDFASSPFRVHAELVPWEGSGAPLRAGVSSFGMGGTNAHAILEEAPPLAPSEPARGPQLLVLSAAAPAALEELSARLADHLEAYPGENLADVAYTLQVGRTVLGRRRTVVAADRAEALTALRGRDPRLLRDAAQERTDRPVAFLFPGQGSQRPGVGEELYREEPPFREAVDRAAEVLAPELDLDLRSLLFPPEDRREEAALRLRDTRWAQPALFVLEHALATLWMERGVRPAALLGHSLGEYVAACLAGVFSLEDALALVARRAALTASLPPGAMVSAAATEERLRELLDRLGLAGLLSVAAVNAPELSTLSGPEEAVAALEVRLSEEGVAHRRLRTSHAFHSAMLEPIVGPFADRVREVALRPPAIPLVSSVTGSWLRAGEATDPAYWADHLRRTVRFADALATLAGAGEPALLEIGPGQGLTGIARRLPAVHRSLCCASLPRPEAGRSPRRDLAEATARLWLAGAPVDWAAFHGGARRRRLPLPTYPFQRRRHWVERRSAAEAWLPEALAGELPAGVLGDAQAEDTPPSEAPAAALDPAPTGATERGVAAIFQELLGVEGVAVHDDFFELGGNSLVATRVQSRLRDAFGVELPLTALFEASTVGALAARVEERRAEGAGANGGPIPRLPAGQEGPLSFPQQRLLFLSVLSPEDVSYNMPLGLRLRGPLRLPALRRALGLLVDRHESLRTRYRLTRGRASQRIVPREAVRLPVVDLAASPEGAAEAEAERRVQAEVARPMDPFSGPLFRSLLLRLGEDEHVLLLVLHHIAADGWSTSVLFRDLVALYEDGDGRRLPPLPVRYADFAAWQRSRLDGEVLERQLDYWRRRLAGLPATAVPPDRPRRAGRSGRSGRGAAARFALPEDVSAELKRFAREREATLFMVLLAGFLVVLHHECGADDLVVGTDVAGRTRSELEDLVGLFVNQVVLRQDLSGDPTLAQLLDRTRRTTLEAYAHQHLPFERLVEALNPVREPGRTPLFEIKLVLQNAPAEGAAPTGLSAARYAAVPGNAKFALLFNLVEDRGSVAGRLEYDADRYEPTSIARLLGEYRAVLEACARRPEARLSAVAAELAAHDRRARTERSRELRQEKSRLVAQVRRRAITLNQTSGET